MSRAALTKEIIETALRYRQPKTGLVATEADVQDIFDRVAHITTDDALVDGIEEAIHRWETAKYFEDGIVLA